MLNGIFEEELVGYRIAGNNQIIDIDSEQEFKAIDEAL